MSGEIYHYDNGCSEWNIGNVWLLSLAGETLGDLKSPNINFNGESYSLQLGPVENEWICLKFCSSKCSNTPQLLVRLGIKTGSYTKHFPNQGETDKTGNLIIKKWMKWNQLIDLTSKQGKTLTIYCKLKKLHPVRNFVSEDLPPNFRRVKEDFKALLSSGEDSDVQIKVKEKVFPAHRNILRARSQVFKAMFSHDMVEKQNGVVSIDDCDPQFFSDFLVYVYTGSCDHVTNANVSSLYAAADRYDMVELKKVCLTFMKKNLSVQGFCNIFSLALRFSEKELVDIATDYFSKNKIEIMKTPVWEIFLHDNTKEANALLVKVLSE